MEDIVPDMKKMSEKYEAGAPGEKNRSKQTLIKSSMNVKEGLNSMVGRL